MTNEDVADRSVLGRAEAHVVAWLAIAAVNAAFVARLRPRPAFGLRLLHHLYDAAQLCAAGAVIACAVSAWRWRGRGSRVVGLLMTALAALALAALYTRPDLEPFAQRVSPDGWTDAVLWSVLVAFASCVSLAAFFGGMLARPWWRLGALASALGVVIVNGVVLRNDYRGVHLFAVLGAAVFAGAALRDAVLPHWLGRGEQRLRWAITLLVSGAVVSIAITPPSAVRAELVRTEGAVVWPLISSVMSKGARHRAYLPQGAEPWYRSRARAQVTPPSTTRLLPRNGIVVLLAIDSMRASLFEQAKLRRRLPDLDRLRRASVDFSMTRAPATRTVLTWGAVFTGRQYSAVKWRGIDPSRDRSVRFPALLSRAGVRTVNVLSLGIGNWKPQLGETNLRGGFTEEVSVLPRAGQPYATTTEAIPEVIAKLRTQGPGPCFLFAHLMDPHYPYDSVTSRGSKFDRYLGEVKQAGKGIQQVIDAIDALGLADRTALIVTADHGEALGAHNTPYHTITLYEELLRVPLFVRIPGVKPRRATQPVSLLDLGPTILDLFGVDTPASMFGQSLVPILARQQVRLTRPIAAERPSTRALILGDHKIIVDEQKGTTEIYDLAQDPNERHNLADTLGDRAQDEINALHTFFETHETKK